MVKLLISKNLSAPNLMDSCVGRLCEWTKRSGPDKGQLHRIDGPAVIKYNRDGEIVAQRWIINDEDITKDILKWLKENDINEPFSEEDIMAIKLRWE